MIKRREFIAGLGSTAAWPVVARAQTERLRRVGLLSYGTENNDESQALIARFRDEMAKLGWIEGRNLRSDLRFSDDVNRMRAQAAEIVRLMPEVIVTVAGASTRAVQQETQAIPIVVVAGGDNTFGKYATSITRPDGNVTGFAPLYPSIAGKWLELLKEVAPHLARVAVVSNPDTVVGDAGGGNYRASIAAAAQVLGLKAIDVPFRNLAELDRASNAFAAEPNGGLIAIPSAATATRTRAIALVAARNQLPSIHWDKSYPAEGGLMSYGSAAGDAISGVASYVDRILRGAKVSDLPVQFPTKFELVINLKTAKALGLTVPETLLALADEVIH